MIKLNIALALALCTALSMSIYIEAAGQERIGIYGDVISESTGAPTRGAIVSLISGKDTLRTQTTASGTFSFKTGKLDNAILTVHHMSYKPAVMELGAVTDNLFLPPIALEEASTELEAAHIVAGMPVYEQIGDTLKYNVAATHNVSEDDMLGDVIDKLPGVSRDEAGRISIMNIPLEKIYINGRTIYGDNPDDALRYLPAEEVISIKVFDELRPEERLGLVKGKDRQRVADVKTKHSIDHALVAQSIAGYGRNIVTVHDETDNRYQGGVAVKWFSENTSWTVNAYSNNLGRDNEIRSVTDISSIADRYSQKSFIGTSYLHRWKDYSSLSGNYSYSSNKSINLSSVRRDYSSIERIDTQTSDSHSRNGTHKLNLAYTSMKQFVPSASLGVEYSRRNSLASASTTMIIDGADAGGYSQKTQSHEYSLSISPFLFEQFRITDNLRYQSFLRGVLSRSNGAGFQADTLLPEHSLTKLVMDSSGDKIDLAFNSELSYTISVATQSLAGLGFGLSRKKEKQEELKYLDYVSEANFQNLVSDSHSFDHFSAEAFLRAQHGTLMGLSVSGSARLSWTNQENTFRYPFQDNIPRHYLLPLAELSIRYGFDLHSRISLNLLTIGNIPSIEQTSTHIDDSDPLNLSTGNSALNPSRTWSGSLNGDFMPGNGVSISLRAEASVLEDKITPVTYRYSDGGIYNGYTIPKGGSIRTYTNTDGAWNGKLTAALKGSIRKIALNYDLTLLYNHGRNPHFLNDRLNIGVTREPKVVIGLSHSFGRNHPVKIRFDGGRFSVTNSIYQDVCYYQGRAGISSRNNIGSRFFVNGNYSYVFRTGITGASNYSSHILNAVAGFKVFKDKKGEIALSAFDMLGDKPLFQTKVSGDITTTTFTPSLGRVWLVSFTYRFNSAKSSELEKKSRLDRRSLGEDF